MNAIVTLAIGHSPLWAHTLPWMRKTAARHGWAFEVIDTRMGLEMPPKIGDYVGLEKLQVVKYLDEYERVLLLDADVMMTPTCPDVFDIVPERATGGVYEDVGTRCANRQGWIEWIKEVSGEIRIERWRGGYLNAGVLVFSQCHRKMLDVLDELDKPPIFNVINKRPWPDQNLFNYLAARVNCPVWSLGYKWNHMGMFSEEWNGAPLRWDSHIIHYAGLTPEHRLAMACADEAVLWGGGGK